MKNKNRDLNGLRILNTRPSEQAKPLSQAIHDAGGIAIDLPMLSISPSLLTWCAQMPPLTKVEKAIFISPNAVKYFFKGLAHNQITWSNNIEVIAIGQGTNEALVKQGVRVDHLPDKADSEHLLKLAALQEIAHQTILLIKGEGGLPTIETTLCARHAQLIPLLVYHRKPPQHNQTNINSLWQEDAVDIILFTSQESMHNLYYTFGASGQKWLCSKPCLVISPRLVKSASALGIKTIINCAYQEILQTLKGFVHDKK